MTAPVTSPMAIDAALWESVSPSWMWRSMFSITTMASSTTSPVARVMPKSERVDGKSQQLDESESSNQGYRNSHCGNNRVATLREKDEDNEDDKDNGLKRCTEHVPDRFAYRFRGIKRILILHAGRKVLGQPVQFGQHQAINFQSIRSRELSTPRPTASQPLYIRSLL